MPTIFLLLLLTTTTITIITSTTATISTTTARTPFIFQGFLNASLILTNSSTITTNGLLMLTNSNSTQQLGHAFLPSPLPLSPSINPIIPSFSTSFVFAIIPRHSGYACDHGMTFALTPSPTLPQSLSSQFLGLFSLNTHYTSNHIVAVELDTVKNLELNDTDSNHVGIDVNSLFSINSSAASYRDQNGTAIDLKLISGKSMQVWIDYYAPNTLFEVTLAPVGIPRPKIPLLSSRVNLSMIFRNEVYVGFTAATGGATGSHYVLAWSFSMEGEPRPPIDINALPPLPVSPPSPNPRTKLTELVIGLVIFGMAVVAMCVCGLKYWVARKRRFEEIVEEEELSAGYGPNRVSYRDLYRATKGFREENLLGVGGFGRVYKGSLGKSNEQVAVKKISHDSNQGVREFMTEITSMARLRHRNLVQLIGYCRRKRELLLVYDYMVNGSLDKYLYGSKGEVLDWGRRYSIVRGVAEGLLYLHEGWEQVVVHRDVKASNVLLDSDFNGRLGDFGLAKIYDRGVQQETTRVVGTLGYLAPEMVREGKATTFTDVYAFGAFLLEVSCGKRPMSTSEQDAQTTRSLLLVDWVVELWKSGRILEAIDKRLGNDYSITEAEMMLKLGILCSQEVPAARPNMRQVVQVLDGGVELPLMPPEFGSGVAVATVVAAAAAAETPLVSYPSPMEQWSLNVQVNSSVFSVS